jgi:twitching motility protein PilU
VGIDTDSWEAALKNTLRQAPDVILMGEIRDRETMEHAVAFAETGHLCMATLHANSANQALDRIINFFPEERRAQLLMDLSLNLRAMVSQRLMPKQDGKGRMRRGGDHAQHAADFRPDLQGRSAEIKEIMKKSAQLGMQTFDQALFDLYEANTITYEDALRNADSLNDLRLQIKLGCSAILRWLRLGVRRRSAATVPQGLPSDISLLRGLPPRCGFAFNPVSASAMPPHYLMKRK